MNEKRNFDYKRLHPFKWYILENFPFLEDSIDVLTNYQLFCKLGEMYNKEVDAINTLGIQVEGLTDWFDNLDVQDEINNKLDDMAESGELEEIIGAYINANAILAFDTLADLKSATNLIGGSYAKTLGYYSINDGGGATYKIRSVTNQDTEDDAFIVALNDNTLVAELIIENNSVNFKQLGAKEETIDNTLYDNKTYLQKYLNYNELQDKMIELLVPSGIYGFSETNITTSKGIKIRGVHGFPLWRWTTTIFVPYNNNQNYIFNFGNTTEPTSNINLSDIIFSSAIYEYNSEISSFQVKHEEGGEIIASGLKQIGQYCLNLLHTTFSNFNNIEFRYIKGGCLQIGSSWELYFNKINIRNIWNITGSLINFDTNNSLISNANLTALNIDNIYAEAITGKLINVSTGCSLANGHIGTINIEPNKVEFYGDSVNTTLTDSFSEPYVNMPFIDLNQGCQCNDFDINNIQINNMAFIVTKFNNINYIYDTIIKFARGTYINPVFNNISVVGQRRDVNVLLYTDTTNSAYQNITLNNVISNDPNYKLKLNVTKLYNITVNNFKNLAIGNNNLYTPNLIPCYKMNYVTANRAFGNITYDSGALNNEKLCINFINNVANPNVNSIDIRGLLPKCSKFHMRCKAPSGASSYTVMHIENASGTALHTIGATINGDGNYKWYSFDVGQYDDIDFSQDIYFKFYPGANSNFELLADVMYFE